jgi:hypothetical protein
MAERYIKVEDAHTLGSPYYGKDTPILEIVRCKDCKHYYADPWGYGNCVFEGGVSRRTKESNFCSWGEDDEKNQY